MVSTGATPPGSQLGPPAERPRHRPRLKTRRRVAGAAPLRRVGGSLEQEMVSELRAMDLNTPCVKGI